MSYKLSNFHNYINIYSNKKTLVNLNNWTCGFGSALSCLIDNITYLNQFNIKVKPLWNKNSDNFKYSFIDISNILSSSVKFLRNS